MLVALLLGALLPSTAAVPSPASRSFALFETHRAPITFRRIADAPRSQTINLRIGLRQPRIQELEAHLYEISDPDHARYGAHFTADEVKSFSAPHASSVEAVAEWLKSHGLEGKWAANEDWVTVPAVAIGKAEEMLDTTYGVYRHLDGDHLVRTESYSLPLYLHDHVELVQPTNMFGRLGPQRSTIAKVDFLSQEESARVAQAVKGASAELSNGNDVPTSGNSSCSPLRVTNDCLRSLYKTIDYVPQATDKNKLGITGYLGEYAQFDDLEMFLKMQRPDQSGYKFSVVSVNGGVNPQGFNSTQLAAHTGIEANLDVQTAAGFTAPTPNFFYTTPGSPPFTPDQATPNNTNEPYLDWLAYFSELSDEEMPKVVTTSYGDDEQTIPKSYAYRACRGFAQLGARGVSMTFSSGDYGVGENGTCVSNDGRNASTFLPMFPASCPYVTAVGGTENFAPEQAVSKTGPGNFFAGGGFSNLFPVPAYQRRDTKKYLAGLRGKYSGLYSPLGRGYPDVAAQGARYVIGWNHTFIYVYGTSASSPTFASVVTLLNDNRLSKGLSVLGFLNPMLYKYGRQGLNDITIGSSAGCNTDGFPAKAGWDAVTGLGTPDFKKLQALLCE